MSPWERSLLHFSPLPLSRLIAPTPASKAATWVCKGPLTESLSLVVAFLLAVLLTAAGFFVALPIALGSYVGYQSQCGSFEQKALYNKTQGIASGLQCTHSTHGTHTHTHIPPGLTQGMTLEVHIAHRAEHSISRYTMQPLTVAVCLVPGLLLYRT